MLEGQNPQIHRLSGLEGPLNMPGQKCVDWEENLLKDINGLFPRVLRFCVKSPLRQKRLFALESIGNAKRKRESLLGFAHPQKYSSV